MEEENSWQTQSFRRIITTKIDEAIQKAGITSKNGIEMESHVFEKAKSKEEYLGLVATLILHIGNMNAENGAPGINYGCEKLNANGDKYNLKISSWNVRGINAIIKKNGLDYFCKEDADIVALQEIKCDTDKLPAETKISGYQCYFHDSKKANFCGVALYSKVKPIEVTYGLPNSGYDDEGRCIIAEYEKFYLVNVNAPNAGRKMNAMTKKMEWNRAFKAHCQKMDEKKPVIICGTLNVAHQEIDLTFPKINENIAGFTEAERNGMTDFLAAGFIDTFRDLYPEKTRAYTFSRYYLYKIARGLGWRVDYYLVSERIKKNICDNVIRDDVFGSDHCPIVLYANL